MEALGVRPIGRTRQSIGQSAEKHEQQVHGKSQPDDKPRPAKAPDFDQAIINNIGNGENDQTRSQFERAERHLLRFEQVCCDETDAEQNGQHHKRQADPDGL